MSESDLLLEAKGLVKEFPVRGGVFGRTVAKVHAVSGVDITLQRGETLGLVGESGCGKSTTGRLLLHLIRPTRGQVLFEGRDLEKLSSKDLRELRQRFERRTLGEVANADLAEGKLMEVKGWVLPESVALLCVLAAQNS